MKKTVLIIEDEFYFRQALKQYLSSHADEFSLCGEARNGEEGLQKIMELKPDIALVDITMPLMDGISLIRKAREAGSKTRMIILTGYGEFDYAKQAIQLGVQDYLLKPLQSDELYQSLSKTAQAIDREQESEKTARILAGTRQEVYSAYRDSLIHELLLNGAVQTGELERNFGFSGTPPIYGAAVLDVHIKNENIWNPGDKKLCRYAICNVVEDLFRGQIGFGTCVNEIGLICMAVHPLREQGADSLLRERMQQVCAVSEEYLGLEVAAYFGGLRNRLEAVRESYQEALAMKKYRLFQERSGVCFFSETRTSQQLSKNCFSGEERKNLLSLMRTNDTEAVHRLIRRVFARMEAERLDPDSVYMHVTDLFSTVLDFAAEYRMKIARPNDTASLFSNILSAPSLEWLQKFVLDAADRIMAQVNPKDTDAQSRLAQRVAEYIDENFGNPHLKLEVIAGEFFINIQYLCAVFKKHRKTTIGNYILEVRMNHAREELLRGAESVTGVAYHCGYEDVGYFSKCFKRYFGISPKKFLTQHTGEPHP